MQYLNSHQHGNKTVTRGFKRSMLGIYTVLVLVLSQSAIADAPLKTTLGLTNQQVKTVSAIQNQYRIEKRAIRQILNKESRKLRRARAASDESSIDKLTIIVKDLESKMAASIRDEDDAVRQMLSEDQRSKFESYLKERDEMVGSSRDVKVL